MSGTGKPLFFRMQVENDEEMRAYLRGLMLESIKNITRQDIDNAIGAVVAQKVNALGISLIDAKATAKVNETLSLDRMNAAMTRAITPLIQDAVREYMRTVDLDALLKQTIQETAESLVRRKLSLLMPGI